METNQTLSKGTKLLNGMYTIVRVLGRGGFGITYLAVHESLGTPVAIKEFFPRGMYNRESDTASASIASRDNVQVVSKLKAKFLKEARRLAALNHGSIVRVSNAFEENATAYFVMDYIEGDDLNTIVKRDGSLSLDHAIGYVRQVGEALAYLHDQRINHLDVKPANILLDKTKDRAVLIDFGLSKQYDDGGLQTSTTPVGISAGYAPMEQYKQGGVEEFSAPTDIYSLGATLYYLLTGQRPPEAASLGDEALVFPSTVPDKIQNAIIKAMSPFRSARYQTVAEFMNALEDEENDVTVIHPGSKTQPNKDNDKPFPLSSEGTNRVEDHNKPDRRSHKTLTVLLSLIALVVLILAIFYSCYRSVSEISGSTDVSPSTDYGYVTEVAADEEVVEAVTGNPEADAFIAKIKACTTSEELQTLATDVAKFQNDPTVMQTIMEAGQAKFNELSEKEEKLAQEKGLSPEAIRNLRDGEEILINVVKENPKARTTRSGLVYIVSREGDGRTIYPDDDVEVKYVATHIDGKVFDSGTATFKPSQTIPGFKEGLTLLSKGAEARLYIPGELGYGVSGISSAGIGPMETLIFDVEVLDVDPAKK